jgi:hypothetical protein
MISKENFDESVEKWTGIVSHLKEPPRNLLYQGSYIKKINPKTGEQISCVEVVDACGFCSEFHTENPNEDEDECGECPLYQESLCHTSGFHTDKLFWKFTSLLRAEKFEEALPFAQRMLDRILAEPVYEKEEE